VPGDRPDRVTVVDRDGRPAVMDEIARPLAGEHPVIPQLGWDGGNPDASPGVAPPSVRSASGEYYDSSSGSSGDEDYDSASGSSGGEDYDESSYYYYSSNDESSADIVSDESDS
jgi:hypothetical protein